MLDKLLKKIGQKSYVDLKSYTDTAYHNEELKSLTRYRFDGVRERAKLKQSVSRLVNILFPELEKLVPSLHLASVYALLNEFPGARQIAEAHLTRLKTILEENSRGHYDRDKAVKIRDGQTIHWFCDARKVSGAAAHHCSHP